MASADHISERNLGCQSWASAPTPCGWEEWVEIGAEITPKVPSNFGQSLSHGCAVPAPFAQGSLRDGGCGLPRRPCGPPRNDNGFLSFRGAERRGNPSFLRWTGVRAAVPRAWPPPTKFRAEIWGVGQVVGPYGRSTEVPATGRCGHRPLRMVAESCRDLLGSALSAERVAGQIQVLPDTLRVQHGVPCPEASARLRPCSRRGCVD